MELRSFLRTVERGQIYRGTITSVQNFGAFVDIGGDAGLVAEGLVNVAELTWRHYSMVADVVHVGQDVVVMVLDVDLDRDRMSLSLKALQDDPFLPFARTRLGDVVTGPVTKVVPFGVFVEVADGIEGLVPRAQLPSGEPPAEGTELTVRVDYINLSRRRVLLTLPT